MQKANDSSAYVPEQWQAQRKNIPLLIYASDLMRSFGLPAREELMASIKRALHACSSLNISIEEHFAHIYRAAENELVSDWKLSPLACYLLAVNGDPANPAVARAQLFFVLKNYDYVKI